MSTTQEDLEKIKSLVKEQRASGQSVKLFCRNRGLSHSAFYRWRNELSEERSGFVQISPEHRVELELSCGVKLRVLVNDLKLVLEALR